MGVCDAVEGLTGYIKEILDGAMSSPMSSGLLRNYLNDTSGDGQGFPEISGSTASAAYRMAVFRPDVFASSPSSNSSNATSSNSNSTYISWADNIRAGLGAYDASGHPHIT